MRLHPLQHRATLARPTIRWRAAVLAASALALMLSGCVTEVSPAPSRGVALKSSRTAPAGSSERVTLPDGPIASPAESAQSINTAVRVAVRPLGAVPFDSQTLPLVSPDGRFLATQIGEAPTWPTILAQPGATLPLRTGIEIYDLTSVPPQRITPAEPLAPGLLLGRSADNSGFLIESPRPDGARWIGRVSWLRGGVTWLARSDAVATGAVLIPGGADETAIVYAQRMPSESRSTLVQTGRNTARFEADALRSMLYPLIACGESRFACFATAPDGLELLVYSLPRESGGVAQVRSHRVLHPAPDPLLAYQAATPMQAFPIACDAAPTDYPDGLVFFHPAAGRMMFMDLISNQLFALAPESISACWMRDATGPALLLTTPDGLVAQRLAQTREGFEVSAPARLLAEPWAPRATTNPDAPFVLIGPGPGNDPTRLNVATLSVLAPEEPDAAAR